uniref:Uncharacterized protein n=1 Tax=Parastrongyloides trichosuri TaxID=131310 RepID=A0A0N4ZWD1_PARTI
MGVMIFNYIIFFILFSLPREINSLPLKGGTNVIDSIEKIKIEIDKKDDGMMEIKNDTSSIKNVELTFDILHETIEKTLNDDSENVVPDGDGDHDMGNEITIEEKPSLLPHHIPDDETILSSATSSIYINDNSTAFNDDNTLISNNDPMSNDIFTQEKVKQNITTEQIIIETTSYVPITPKPPMILHPSQYTWWTKFMAGIRCALKDCSKIHEIMRLEEEKNGRGLFEGSYMRKMV